MAAKTEQPPEPRPRVRLVPAEHPEVLAFNEPARADFLAAWDVVEPEP